MTVLQFVIIGMVLIIIATVTLAVLSYGAFKVRERRSPSQIEEQDTPLFFERVKVVPRRQNPDPRTS